MNDPVRSDHVRTYGIWAWAVGIIFGGLLIWFMFAFADGFV